MLWPSKCFARVNVLKILELQIWRFPCPHTPFPHYKRVLGVLYEGSLKARGFLIGGSLSLLERE